MDAASLGTGQDAQSVSHRHHPTAPSGSVCWDSCCGVEKVFEKLLDQPQHHPLLGEVLPGRVLCSTTMGVMGLPCASKLPL